MLSRVADSLYWMSRYLERAEHMARAVDVQLHLALDEAPSSASMGWVCLLNSLRADLPAHLCADDRAITDALTFDRRNPSSIVSCLEQARENARQIREQITSDVWEEINRLYLVIREMNVERLWQVGPHQYFRSVQRGAQLLAGVADSTMEHDQGWQFIRLGRFMERAIGIAWLLDAHFGMRGTELDGETSPDDFIAWSGLLRSCTAFEPYCKSHTIELRPRWILQFLLLDAEFPHSVRFAAMEMQSAIAAIAEWTGTPRSGHASRLAGRLGAMLNYGTIDEVLDGELGEFLSRVVALCWEIHQAVYSRFIGYTVDEALRGQLTAVQNQ